MIDELGEAGLNTELLTPSQSVAAQLAVIERLTPEDNGAFLSYTGETATAWC